jgi:hypothetical protein
MLFTLGHEVLGVYEGCNFIPMLLCAVEENEFHKDVKVRRQAREVNTWLVCRTGGSTSVAGIG